MQSFAVDAGALNGDPQVWADGGSATVALQAAGAGMRGAAGSGSATVAFQSSGQVMLQAYLAGQATVALQANGSIIWGAMLGGSARVALAADGQAVRRVLLEGSPQIAVKASGDVAVVQAVSASFPIVFSARGELHVAKGQQGIGLAPIVMAAEANVYVKPATRLGGYARVEMAAAGQGSLRMMLPAGAAVIRTAADGAARFGLRHNVEGAAVITTFATGRLDRWRYVFAGGTASIQVLAKAERHGTPAIPTTYAAAPSTRSWRVREERRGFTVPFERRA